MKALFILYPQHVSNYQAYRASGGYRFIETVIDETAAYNVVQMREQLLIEGDGTLKDDNGRIVWEEGYNNFDFGDYQYLTFDLAKLQPNDYSSHGNMWTAIQIEKPWNMDEIEAIVNANQ